ncbi:MAG: hypothetical protein L3J66_05050 [Bacteroidales bacterium]|nr:hypothetical protein [Bacteroidales bacterium]
MEIMRIVRYFCAVLLLLEGGCASFTSFQTADVLAKGETNFTVSGSLLYSLPEISNVYEEGNQFVTQFMLRRGISGNSEFQALISPNSFNANYKHLYFRAEKFMSSYTAGIGYTFLASSFDDQTHVFDVPVSLYLTYLPKEHFGITINPKVMYRYIGDESTVIFGGSLNLMLGKKIKFYPEGIIFYDAVIGTLFTGGGLGISF